jgi:hypothetical protein
VSDIVLTQFFTIKHKPTLRFKLLIFFVFALAVCEQFLESRISEISTLSPRARARALDCVRAHDQDRHSEQWQCPPQRELLASGTIAPSVNLRSSLKCAPFCKTLERKHNCECLFVLCRIVKIRFSFHFILVCCFQYDVNPCDCVL